MNNTVGSAWSHRVVERKDPKREGRGTLSRLKVSPFLVQTSNGLQKGEHFVGQVGRKVHTTEIDGCEPEFNYDLG